MPAATPEQALAGDDASPRIATDGRGHWLAVWHSTGRLGSALGDDFDILVTRSTDDGRTWTARRPLNSNAATDSGHDFRPDVASDGEGHWVAVWESEETLGGTVGPDADIFVARSSDDGASWTPPVPLDSGAFSDLNDDGRPQVVADGRGHWLVVWHDEDPMGGPSGKDADILCSRSTDNGASWSPASGLNTDAAADKRADGFPRVATDGHGHWTAVWSAEDLPGGPYGNDADVLVARSADNGATWTPPVALNSNARGDTGFDMYPQVATDSHGRWVVVWQSYDTLGGTIGDDADVLVARSTDDGATWTAPAPLHADAATDTHYDLNPTLATDGTGHWLATWLLDDSWGKQKGTDTDLRVSSSTDGGTSWSLPAQLNNGAADDVVNDGAPDVATDRAGHWVAVWQASDVSNGSVATTSHIVVARSTDAGARWTAPATPAP